MNPQNTVDTLKAMRFSAMANEFERQLSDLASYGQLGFEDRFSLLVDAEWNRRQQNKLARIIHEARFAHPGAEIEDINATRTESWTRFRFSASPLAGI